MFGVILKYCVSFLKHIANMDTVGKHFNKLFVQNVFRKFKRLFLYFELFLYFQYCFCTQT